MKKTKITAGIIAIAMSATVAAGITTTAYAADYDFGNTSVITLDSSNYVNYTSSAFYSISKDTPAPMGMDTLCIAGTTTDSSGNVTVKLKKGTLSILSFINIDATIVGCTNLDTGDNYFNSATTDCPYGYILIPAADITTDSKGGYVDVSVKFGDKLASIMNDISKVSKMTNPMDLRLRLF